MYWSERDGVFFVEGRPPGATLLRPIKSALTGGFSQAQLKTLDHLKDVMAREVIAAGGNAVVDFTYGQKSTFWNTLWSIDDVFWRGGGTIASIDPGKLTK